MLHHLKFERIVPQVNMHRLTESEFRFGLIMTSFLSEKCRRLEGNHNTSNNTTNTKCMSVCTFAAAFRQFLIVHSYLFKFWAGIYCVKSYRCCTAPQIHRLNTSCEQWRSGPRIITLPLCEQQQTADLRSSRQALICLVW